MRARVHAGNRRGAADAGTAPPFARSDVVQQVQSTLSKYAVPVNFVPTGIVFRGTMQRPQSRSYHGKIRLERICETEGPNQQNSEASKFLRLV